MPFTGNQLLGLAQTAKKLKNKSQMPIPLAIPIAMSAAGVIGSFITRAQANKKLRGQLESMPKPEKMAGLAQTLLNARMPGAARAEQNIFQAQANQMAQAQRAATSGNQLLLAGAGAAGQTGQALGQLQQQEAANYDQRLQNLQQAKQADYANSMQEMQSRMQIEGAIQQNKQATFGELTNLGLEGAKAYISANKQSS
jgi:hypothetical protein